MNICCLTCAGRPNPRFNDTHTRSFVAIRSATMAKEATEKSGIIVGLNKGHVSLPARIQSQVTAATDRWEGEDREIKFQFFAGRLTKNQTLSKILS